MTKQQLLDLGLTEEQIPEIFKLNGIAVTNAQGDLATKETELASVKEQLIQANTQIDGFKDLDVEGIKKASEDYKAKFEEAQTQAEKEILNLKFEHELEGAIRDSKAKNIKAVKALLDIETLKGSTNRLEDIKQALETIKTDNDYLFTNSEISGTGGSKGNGGKNKPGEKNPFSKESFNLTEQGRLFREEPELAKQLMASAK